MDKDVTFISEYRVVPLDGGFVVEIIHDQSSLSEKHAFTSASDLAGFFHRVQAGRQSLRCK
ncbi:hypothetical protein [Ochrobactrum chromiisoli]|uniref:Uncharacterized protein n=1 Tax=Ochrobactrum chromiisoli TaxID=2993941 RepID=A0ABT3QUK5_9HYPH|nr:hypothetical protein [Ochrobactrum chromiisoli]MCX2699273.1 hypothetical protein [Ochrobactrum chromiisoli]